MWHIFEGPLAHSLGGEFVSHRWTVERFGEQATVVVVIAESLLTNPSNDLDVAMAVETKGRSVVERLLGFTDIPDQVALSPAHPEGHLTSHGRDRGYLAPSLGSLGS